MKHIPISEPLALTWHGEYAHLIEQWEGVNPTSCRSRLQFCIARALMELQTSSLRNEQPTFLRVWGRICNDAGLTPKQAGLGDWRDAHARAWLLLQELVDDQTTLRLMWDVAAKRRWQALDEVTETDDTQGRLLTIERLILELTRACAVEAVPATIGRAYSVTASELGPGFEALVIVTLLRMEAL